LRQKQNIFQFISLPQLHFKNKSYGKSQVIGGLYIKHIFHETVDKKSDH